MTNLTELRAADVAAGSPQCRGCGCTNQYACEPPCWWIGPGYCSSCHTRDIEDLYKAERGGIDTRLDRKLWKLEQEAMDGQQWRCRDLLVVWSIGRYGDGGIWLHLSVSRSTMLPTYSDMTRAKTLFVGDHRYAYTVMPATTDHVNLAPRCLHIWAPLDQTTLPLPDFTRGMRTI